MDDGTGGRDLTELLKEVCEQLEPVFAYGGSLTTRLLHEFDNVGAFEYFLLLKETL